MTKRTPTTVAANGAPPDTAFSLFVGSVMHARLKPVGHRFTYRVFSVLADLDRLGEARRLSPLFAVNRFAPISLHERDHGPGDGSPLRPHVDRLLAEAGVARPDRVLMLSYPRILGYVFDPITVYFAYRGDELAALLYEVRNTFGERHTYVAPVRDGEATAAGIVQQADKAFYVSPFMPMDETYRFHILPPGHAVRLRIMERDRDGPTLSATFVGEHRPATRRSLAHAFATIPLMTFKVIAGIHYEALRLWWKRVPLVPRVRPDGKSRATHTSPADVTLQSPPSVPSSSSG
ncbi:DUF1365 domain-containing protein [Amorphus orientalis]|uniref:DUF1365 family protein n=1 Tax=Amorphus orientalis TaxID=649198 RepID=A0AAE3VQJ4_9HYPH|nr:DUF1365 domain-containing protein [Amorphus orientalis]MDQ0316328.1 DUF1365 family protein [Amorphus orientalis]